MNHAGEPTVVNVTAGSAERNARLDEVIEDLRARSDAFVFLAGGASNMSPADEQHLLGLFDALAILVREGRRFTVGDGGTQAGIMEAAGKVRERSGRAFPLIGVSPAAGVPPLGRVPVDPNHSHIIVVHTPVPISEDEAWGSETVTMYEVFERLARGRPSVAVVANGGSIVLREVDENVRARRPIILLAGSGRATDALVSLIENIPAPDGELAQLRAKAEELGLGRHAELFRLFQADGGSAAELARLIGAVLDAGVESARL